MLGACLSGIIFFLFYGLDFKQILSALIFFTVIVLGIKVTDYLVLDREERAYREWEQARITISNYSSRLPKYEKNEQFYLSNGIDKFNFQLMEKRNTPEDWEIYSFEHIKAIGDRRSISLPFRIALLMSINCIRFSRKIWKWCAIVVLLALLVCNIRYKIKIMLSSMAGGAIIFILALLGRVPVRISDSVAFILIMFLTYLILDALNQKKDTIKMFSQKVYIAICFILIMCSVRTLYLNYKDCCTRPTIADDVGHDERILLRETLEELGKREGNIYLLSCRGGGPSLSPTLGFQLFEHIPDGFASNQYYIFGGQVRQPYYVRDMKSAGIDNPMTALFEKDNVYSDYDEEVLLFLKRNYGEDIEMKVVDEINGYQIVKYYRSE